MNRRIKHRDLEDTESADPQSLCVLQNSVLDHSVTPCDFA